MTSTTRPTPKDVPDHVMDSLARGLVKAIPAMELFYEDPENQRRFEEWQAKKYGQANA